jgi:hypothetical protein
MPRSCTKAFFANQAAARSALDHVRNKLAYEGSQRLPVRVYPCDVCEGWHLTAKPVQGRTPAWDKDPNWVRPNGTAHRQQRSAVQPVKKSRRARYGPVRP